MRNNSGATAIEYSLIAVVIITAAGVLGTKLSHTCNNVANRLS